MTNTYESYVARPRVKAVGMSIEIDDMAEGERYTSGVLILSNKDYHNGFAAVPRHEQLPWLEIQIVNRDYLLQDVTLSEPKKANGRRKEWRVKFGAADLSNIIDWRVRGERLANFTSF